jgi:hypothetical protein
MSHPHHEIWIRLLEIDPGGVAEGRISQRVGRWRGERDVSETDMVGHSGAAADIGADVEQVGCGWMGDDSGDVPTAAPRLSRCMAWS